VKIPPENHPLFRAALPRDPRIQTLNMFGGVAAKVNGNLFGGTFGRSVMLLLSPEDRETALALDGAAPFDPMGNGAMRSDKVQMPDSLMDEPDDLRTWVKRAFHYATTLPAKAKGGKAPARSASPAKKKTPAPTASPAKKAPAPSASRAKKTPAKAPAAKKTPAKASAAKKPAAKKSLTARGRAAKKRAAK
jgi:TfoX/Sxy family transcriptional regulator of competence genes